MIPSDKKQRQLIGIGCAQLGIDKSTKEDMLLERYGKRHTTEISKLQAALFLKELAQKGFVIRSKSFFSPWKRKERSSRKTGVLRTGNVTRLATREQFEKIAAVAGLIEWQYADGLDRWMQQRLKIDKIRTAADAFIVIEGLKKMFENHMKKTVGPLWRERIYDDPGIEMYIREHGSGRKKNDGKL
jgi:hypothetical protein